MISVITFYTPEYGEEVKEWSNSCSGYLTTPFKAYSRPSKGSWVHNCTMKAEVILEALNEGGGVVWTDADARFKAFPKLFQELENYDFGCYWIPNVWNKPKNVQLRPWGFDRGNEALAGGTLFFNNTQITKDLITDWKGESEANPTRWEQQSLQKIWDKYDRKGLKTFNFPQGYCRVFDAPWFEPENEVVIEHTQASRRLRRTIK